MKQEYLCIHVTDAIGTCNKLHKKCDRLNGRGCRAFSNKELSTTVCREHNVYYVKNYVKNDE